MNAPLFGSVQLTPEKVGDIGAINAQCEALAISFRNAVVGNTDRCFSPDARMAFDHLTAFSMWAARSISREGQ